MTGAENRPGFGAPHVLIAIPVLMVGGTEVQTLHQVRVLTNAGYRVSLCCFYRHDESMRDEMERAGATVILLAGDCSERLISLLSRLVTLFRERRPDVVHVQYLAPGFIPVLAARLAGIPAVFATVHQPARPYGRGAKLLLRAAARLTTAFFCNSLAVERSWFGNAALLATQLLQSRRHFTIYNAVDVEKVMTLASRVEGLFVRREFGLGAGPVIGCVGRLRREKGQTVLLDAMKSIAGTFPGAVLLMVGDGPDRECLRLKAQRLGIAGKVVWAGEQSSEQVFRLFGAMDLVVIPSHFEGFGLVAAEAMAAGLPVVASEVDGLVEVVAAFETGLLVPPGDVTALAEGVVTLLADGDRRKSYGRNAQARVKSQFSLERYAMALLAAYGQVIHGM